MKILITTSILPPEIGGPASYVPEIIQRLGDKFQFKVITFTPNPKEIPGVEITSISKSGNFLTRQLSLFFNILKIGINQDIFFTQDPITVGLATSFAAKILGKKIVIKFVGDDAWEVPFNQGRTKKFLEDYHLTPDSGFIDRVFILITKFTFLLTDKIITPSKYLASVVENIYGINKKKIVVIYNARENIPPPVKKINQSGIYKIVYVGRIIVRKKIDGIIEAVASLNKKGIKTNLVIIGEGPEKENLKKLAANLKFVSFLGRKKQDEALKIVAGSDLSVLNSVYEGLPHTIIESFAMGTPVVATEIPGTNEIAINNQTALTVPPDDTKALAKAIEKMLKNKKLSSKLTKAGFDLISKQFNWQFTIKHLEKVLTEL